MSIFARLNKTEFNLFINELSNLEVLQSKDTYEV